LEYNQTIFYIILELFALTSITWLSLEDNFKDFQYPHNPHNPPARKGIKNKCPNKSPKTSGKACELLLLVHAA
jgi:hypothetical protein